MSSRTALSAAGHMKEHMGMTCRKGGAMIKLRWMGTPDELIWFRRHLEEDQNLRLENVSRILPIRTSNRHFRMMGEVCIADPSEGIGGNEQEIKGKE